MSEYWDPYEYLDSAINDMLCEEFPFLCYGGKDSDFYILCLDMLPLIDYDSHNPKYRDIDWIHSTKILYYSWWLLDNLYEKNTEDWRIVVECFRYNLRHCCGSEISGVADTLCSFCTQVAMVLLNVIDENLVSYSHPDFIERERGKHTIPSEDSPSWEGLNRLREFCFSNKGKYPIDISEYEIPGDSLDIVNIVIVSNAETSTQIYQNIISKAQEFIKTNMGEISLIQTKLLLHSILPSHYSELINNLEKKQDSNEMNLVVNSAENITIQGSSLRDSNFIEIHK